MTVSLWHEITEIIVIIIIKWRNNLLLVRQDWMTTSHQIWDTNGYVYATLCAWLSWESFWQKHVYFY